MSTFYSIHITFIGQRFIFVILVMLPRIKINWDSWDGAVARAIASHQCVPGSIPGSGVICGLTLLLVLYSSPRGFSPGTPAKTNIYKFLFDPGMQGHFKRVLVNSWCSVGKQITVTFTFTFKFTFSMEGNVKPE